MAFTFASQPNRFIVRKYLTKIVLMFASDSVAYSPAKAISKKARSQCQYGSGEREVAEGGYLR